jgi:hypothetical protein
MWKVDESGTFQFSDATDPAQSVLFERGPDASDLRRRIVAAFKGRDISIKDLEEFVITHTPYRETHIRQCVLRPMEKADPPELTIVASPTDRKKSFYPEGTIIRFL